MSKPKGLRKLSNGRWVCPKCGLSHAFEKQAQACCVGTLKFDAKERYDLSWGQTPVKPPIVPADFGPGVLEPGGVIEVSEAPMYRTDGKATNPKDAAAFDKAPLHLVPASFKAYTALALAEGAMKYGSWNWRAAGVRASVYVSALQRHIDKWFNGEEFDPETGVPHLANAAACLAVLIDSKAQMNMTDDRPPRQYGLPDLVNKDLPHAIAGLREKFADKNPKHWTINDGGKEDL